MECFVDYNSNRQTERQTHILTDIIHRDVGDMNIYSSNIFWIS